VTTPKRIQLSRARGWKKPEGAIVVSRPTRWGNPFVATKTQPASIGRAEAVDFYRRMLESGRLAVTVADVRTELAGKDLCCWCPLPDPGEPDLCHAAVLLATANRPALPVDREEPAPDRLRACLQRLERDALAALSGLAGYDLSRLREFVRQGIVGPIRMELGR